MPTVPNAERGVYRTTDGGANLAKGSRQRSPISALRTWLSKPEKSTGDLRGPCGRRARPPLERLWGRSKAPGSGLYKSTDGGDHWSQLTGNGLPEGAWRRSGVAGRARNPRPGASIALIDAASGSGLFRSDDAAKTWTHVGHRSPHRQPRLVFQRHHRRPQESRRGLSSQRGPSTAPRTAAKKLQSCSKARPGGDDYHYLWIDPADSSRMILAFRSGHQHQHRYGSFLEQLVQSAHCSALSRHHR